MNKILKVGIQLCQFKTFRDLWTEPRAERKDLIDIVLLCTLFMNCYALHPFNPSAFLTKFTLKFHKT